METQSLSPYRRSHKRYNMDTQAALIVDKGLRKPLILKDISTRGAGIVSSFPLETNSVEIAMALPFFFDKPVYRKARVAWCRKVSEKLWEGGLDFGLDNLINFEVEVGVRI